MKELSLILNIVNDDLKDRKDRVELLEQNNKALELRNAGLKKDNNKLKEKNKTFQDELDKLKMKEKFKQKISDLYNFFVNKMWGNKEKRDKYYGVAYELYGNNILDKEQMQTILNTKNRSAEIDNKSRKDDFDINM